MIPREHAAVETAAEALRDGGYSVRLARAGIVLDHALPHLTADDLRDTDAGRALLAEAYQHAADVALAVADNGAAQQITKAGVDRINRKDTP